jgi:hypothetical protein
MTTHAGFPPYGKAVNALNLFALIQLGIENSTYFHFYVNMTRPVFRYSRVLTG